MPAVGLCPTSLVHVHVYDDDGVAHDDVEGLATFGEAESIRFDCNTETIGPGYECVFDGVALAVTWTRFTLEIETRSGHGDTVDLDVDWQYDGDACPWAEVDVALPETCPVADCS